MVTSQSVERSMFDVNMRPELASPLPVCLLSGDVRWQIIFGVNSDFLKSFFLSPVGTLSVSERAVGFEKRSEIVFSWGR
jgi:hypothetical protein